MTLANAIYALKVSVLLRSSTSVDCPEAIYRQSDRDRQKVDRNSSAFKQVFSVYFATTSKQIGFIGTVNWQQWFFPTESLLEIFIRKNLRAELLTTNEVLGQLREQGIFDVDEVKLAYMEGDGGLGVKRFKEEADSHKPKNASSLR